MTRIITIAGLACLIATEAIACLGTNCPPRYGTHAQPRTVSPHDVYHARAEEIAGLVKRAQAHLGKFVSRSSPLPRLASEGTRS